MRLAFCLKLRGCLLAALLFSAACNTPVTVPRYTIGFSQCTGADKWRQTMLEEMQRELSLVPEVQLIYRDADGSSDMQLRQIRELVNMNIDLLIVSPNEVQPLSPVIQSVYEAGIPVVVVDRRTNNKEYSAFIGAENYEVGQTAGRYAASLLKGKGNIMEVTGLPDASPVIDRHRGFRNAIIHFPSLKYVCRVDGNWEQKPFHETVKDSLLAHPEIDLIFAQNDRMAYEIRQVCEEMGPMYALPIIGIDGLPAENEGIDMVDKKIINATILYPTGGGEAILTALNILNGRSYNKETQLFTTVIDSTNVRIMKMQNEKAMAQQRDIDRRQKKIEEQVLITRNQSNIIYGISVSLALGLIFGSILFYYFQENKKINARLQHQNEEIIEQRNRVIELGDQAKAATDAKISFFTNMSHEFRTPLTLILGPLEELSSNIKLPYAAQQHITLIQKNVMRLLRLINQLIDFRRIDAEKMKIQATENDLLAFLNDIAEAFKGTAQKRGIDFKVISRDRQLLLWFDTSMMDKVIFNLLSNAFKFTNDYGYIHVLVNRDERTNEVLIKVEDNGIGMTEEEAAHAFELFYQAKSLVEQGSGLGLSLSRELIHLHHGSISVSSSKKEGTSFEIRLPMGAAHLEEDEIFTEKRKPEAYLQERIYYVEPYSDPVTSPSKLPEGKFASSTVLIIEDNPDLRNFLAQKLQTGFDVLEAADGLTGIQMAFDNIPDLIISDLILPGKSGMEITNQLKNDIRTSHIPIVLLTAKSDTGSQIEGMKSKADAYIVKPFNLSFLEETLRSVLSNRELLRAHYSSELNIGLKSQNHRKLDRRFINEFTSIVDENLSKEEFSVEQIAKLMGISRVQLYRKVKALLDCNVNDYILQARIHKAKQLLLQTNLSISEISFNTGFNSASYFSTVFKSKMGVAPKEFRERTR